MRRHFIADFNLSLAISVVVMIPSGTNQSLIKNHRSLVSKLPQVLCTRFVGHRKLMQLYVELW